jgi:hypothetical protein
MMLLLAILVVAIAQGQNPITNLARGSNSGIDETMEVVVRSEADWQTLWKSHAGAEPAPAVDFSRELVAAIFLGPRRSGGFSAEITGYRREGPALVIDYIERMPAPGGITTQALTSPFHIVKLPRFDGPVRFQKNK